MAQAARLKLRMQKELKLLLTDPPHGTSFPFLSPHSEFSDLSSIDAQIEGPEETVYAKGIFKIKIQIPERYPLQPPIVTFGTPIYHPNIDNGGRICLDILNLPPKGAWQPSLNISTVLISIRLLLSEPNPDDGLMCEASREYKYNRQAFDHKARSMTEKYAKAGAGENSCSNKCAEPETDTNSPMMEVQVLDKEPTHGADELIPSHKKPHGISHKLSLESTSSNKKTDDAQEVKKMPDYLSFPADSINQMDGKRKREKENEVLNECNLNHEKENGKGRKSSNQFKDDFDNKENVDPNNLSSPCQHRASAGSSLAQASLNQQLDQRQDGKSANSSIKSSSKLCQRQEQPFGCMESLQTCDNVKMLGTAEVDFSDRMDNISANAKSEKLGSVGKKLSLGLKGSSRRQQVSNKENVMPNHNLPPSKPQTPGKSGLGHKLSLVPLSQVQQEGRNQKQQSHQAQRTETDVEIKQTDTEETEESSRSENVVVLDSEDSEEEGRAASLRKRMPLAGKRLGKWRVKA